MHPTIIPNSYFLIPHSSLGSRPYKITNHESQIPTSCFLLHLVDSRCPQEMFLRCKHEDDVSAKVEHLNCRISIVIDTMG